MKKLLSVISLTLVFLTILLSGCVPIPTTPAIQPTNTLAHIATPTETSVPPTPQGKTIIVTSIEDSGDGTLRQALRDADAGDTIIFDPTIFLPDSPVSIILKVGLPPIDQGYLTIDASNAGVILDGSRAGGEGTPGIELASDHNVIYGLQITNFTGPGVLINPSARFNTIGGDRSIGPGLLGQGNLLSNNSDGLGIMGSDNHISGNLIGTDITGSGIMGNRVAGVFLNGDASHNTIGPDNIIAYNGVEDSGAGGVEITSADVLGNIITGNSIHDNSAAGIKYIIKDGASFEFPVIPTILGFDIETGFVEGAACSNCVVEIFSTSAMDGEIFEGQVVADDIGYFSLNKDNGFSGPWLTATSQEQGKNTSSFSMPTATSTQVVDIQSNNTNPKRIFAVLPTAELPFNGLGEMFYIDNTVEPDFYVSDLDRLGLKWIRVSVDYFDWPEVEYTGEYSDLMVTPRQKEAIDLLYENDIKILYTLVYWDPEIKTYAGYSRFRTEEEIQRFLDYVRFIVGEFKGKIEWYSLLNEPNLIGGDQRHVKVDDYINVARQVIPIIRELDPQAKILVGEVSPLDEVNSYEYLMQILNSDLMPDVDGIVWHGSSGLSLDYKPDFYRMYPTWVENIVNISRDNGFKGQFFATEFHWRTPDTPQPIDGMPWFYSNIVSAKYYARGIVFHRGLGMITGIGHEGWETIPQVVQVVHSLTTLLAGAEPAELPVDFNGQVDNIQRFSFITPNGDRMLALWVDNQAVDVDPGIEIDLVISGVDPQKTVAVDPLFGFGQEIITTVENNELLINAYLIKDYPTFIIFKE